MSDSLLQEERSIYLEGVNAERTVVGYQALAGYYAQCMYREQQLLVAPIYSEMTSYTWSERRRNYEALLQNYQNAQQQAFIWRQHANFYYERYLYLERHRTASANTTSTPAYSIPTPAPTDNTFVSPTRQTQPNEPLYMTVNQGSSVIPPTPVFVTQPGRLPVNLSQGAVQTESRGVFVGNIAYNTDMRQLKTLFERVGTVVRCHVPTHPNRKNKGYAIVTYKTGGDAMRACESFDGKALNGRTLRVRLDRHEDVKR